MKRERRKVLLVTGVSGAGLSSALAALEDLGWKAVDNLPLSLIPQLLKHKKGEKNPVAVGMDCRTWDFSKAVLLKELGALRKKKDMDARLVYIDCRDDVLQQRFADTRRAHPLAMDRPVRDGIAAERKKMAALRDLADHVIDTTDMTVHDLRRHIRGYFRQEDDEGLHVFVQSFSFKRGLPRDADIVFDARFLDNPHWDKTLRPLTGQNPAVVKKVRGDPAYAAFFGNMTGMLNPILPRYQREGKNYITIAVGCTGGQHRSVAVAEHLHGWLETQGYSAAVRHRDMKTS